MLLMVQITDVFLINHYITNVNIPVTVFTVFNVGRSNASTVL